MRPRPIELSGLLGSGGVDEVQQFTRECILGEAAASHNIAETGLVAPFADPGVRRSRRRWLRLLRRM
eukprot:1895174-Alexandrium_andersonii.AAC.1